jgi:signal peptidase I
MEPTLRLGEVALYTTESVDEFVHGEVVVVKHPDYYGGDAVPLRIVGLGGDVVEIENGQLLVNHKAKPEPYLLGAAAENDFSKQLSVASVPEAFAFMLGDCRDNSNDSRLLGPMPLEAIVGKVKMVHPLDSPKTPRAVR